MLVKQIYEYVNEAQKEVLGEESVLQEDLSNLVDVGEAILNANKYDAYVKALVNRIGKTIFVARVYKGRAPKVLMDAWEFGSILQKVSGDLPEASENESWELEHGTSYDQDVFYKPTVEAKFYNSKTTFEIDMSFTELQLKQSFTSAQEMNTFISMLYNEVDKSLTVKVDALIMRTINSMIAESIYAQYGASALSGVGGTKAINLLALYKDEVDSSSTLTASTCLYSKDFLRFASAKIMLYSNRLEVISRLFNVGAKARFTPKDMQRIVMLDVFVTQSATYLDSDTFHNELVKLPNADVVAYWQGSGTDYSFGEVSKIDVKLASDKTKTVEVDGVLAVIFDRDALGVANTDRRVTTHYNAKAEFYNNFYKHDASFFNDLNENCIVFFVKDAE